MKATIEVIKLASDIVTTSGGTQCPSETPMEEE